MSEKTLRELNRLGRGVRVPVQIPLDENGFMDRVCPHEVCGGVFKVVFTDWRSKVKDEGAFCPFCRHESPATEWNTPDQQKHIRNVGLAHVSRTLGAALKADAGSFNSKQPSRGILQMSLEYRPGYLPRIVPLRASDAFRQDFVCEVCECRYSSLGASFFCPSCGHNSAESSFDRSLQVVSDTVRALNDLRQTLAATHDVDLASDATRQILEDQLGRIVGAFERFNEALFARLPNRAQFKWHGSIFQRVDAASALWGQATGKTYADFLDAADISVMKILVQRRHVLSHHQGIVDQAYIDKSCDSSYRVGQRLVVKAEDVLEMVRILGTLTAGLRKLMPPARVNV